jgi:hypothetical protein
MGMNSHNPSINESQKPWARPITPDEYDISVGRRCPKCLRLYPDIRGHEKPRCRHKKKPRVAE